MVRLYSNVQYFEPYVPCHIAGNISLLTSALHGCPSINTSSVYVHVCEWRIKQFNGWE